MGACLIVTTPNIVKHGWNVLKKLSGSVAIPDNVTYEEEQ